MQIALRHLQECFYMQSSEMMLACKILTNIQTQVKLKTTLILFFFNPCILRQQKIFKKFPTVF